MRELLFLAHRVPYPPDRGDKMRSFHLLQAAAERVPVHLVAFADDEAEIAQAETLRPFLASMHIALRKPLLPLAAAKALASRCPVSVTLFGSKALQAHVDRLLARDAVDTAFAFSSQMAQFLRGRTRDRRFVMDFVDMDSEKFAAYAVSARIPARWLWAREAELLFRWERKVAAAADVSLFVSEAEAALFRQRSRIRPRRVRVVENGIDSTLYDPSAVEPVELAAGGPLIVFTGQMDYRPNVEAVTGFARDVLPRIRASVPGVRFAIVGRDPVSAVRRLEADESVIVTGPVPDVRGWLAAAHAVVAPLAIARGVQNKVLEAMAMARPVIASPAAFEGIDAEPGRDLLVAHDPRAMAEAVTAVLEAPARAAEIGRAARAQVLARYGWDRQLARFLQLLEREPAEAPAPALVRS